MAIEYSFVDNATYGTNDINAITKDLTGAGIAPFPTQDTYNTSDLNALTAALTASGTSLEGCLCTKNGNVVKVAPGIIFFENGVRMRVDGDGYEMPVTGGTAGYVYAYFNTSLQNGGIEFAEEMPENGCVVLLAKITASGELKDMRTFARSKVASFGSNLMQQAEFTILSVPILKSTDGSYKTLITRRLENVDFSKFHYAFISFMQHRGIYDLNTEKFTVCYAVDNNGYASGTVSGNTTGLAYLPNSTTVEIIKMDNTLVATQRSGYTTDQYTYYPMTVTLV